MDLALSEDQASVQQVFDSFFQRAQIPDRIRSVGADGFDAVLWASMCDMGAPGIAVADQDGGAGAGLLDAAVVCEQAGRHIAPVPLVDACVAARLLATLGASDLAKDVISGERIASVALRPADDGLWLYVPNGAIADLVVGMSGNTLVAVAGASSDPAAHNLADLAIGHRSSNEGTSTVLASGAHAARAFQQALDEWRLLAAASLVGMASGALALAVSYVKERTQFGVALGTFQSIAHHLADCHAAVDGARLLCQEAAWSLDNESPDSSTLALMAFYFAAQTAEQSATKSLHFHGGYGFMLEYDIQLYYRRAKAWSLLHGDRQAALDEVAERLFATAGTD